MSNQMLSLEDKMPLLLQAARGMSLGEEFDAPHQRLELSSSVKSENSSVFLQISPSPWLECEWEGAGGCWGRSGPIGLGL